MATEQTYNVTLLNVGGDNNDPLEYFAGVPEDAKQVMNKIIEEAVGGDASSNLKARVIEYNKNLYTQWKSGLGEGENPFTNYGVTNLSVIPEEMPDIKSRFRSAIRQKTVFNKDTFPVIMKAISETTPPESRGNLPGEINDLITGHLDNNKDLFNKSVDKNLEKYMRDESEAIKVLVNFSEQPDYSKIKQKDFFRLGAIFEIYVHIVTLFEGYHTLQKVEKQKVQNFIDNYESISSNILALKQNSIVNLLNQGNNNIVLLNECTTKADEVNPYKFAVKKNRNEPIETYSAICVSSDLDLDDNDDFVAVISNYIRDNHIDWVAEFAVSKITETDLYFVCIHCNSFKNDEDDDDAKKNERSNKIKQLIEELANFTTANGQKIILGIDTNTGTFQSSELQTVKLLAPLEMNENGQVQNGVSSNQYFTVNKERSFYNPQISKAGELEKKTKDIILGIGFKETNNQPQILNYNGIDWEAVQPTENTMAPNMTNPFDHFAVRFNFNYKGQPVPTPPPRLSKLPPPSPLPSHSPLPEQHSSRRDEFIKNAISETFVQRGGELEDVKMIETQDGLKCGVHAISNLFQSELSEKYINFLYPEPKKTTNNKARINEQVQAALLLLQGKNIGEDEKTLEEALKVLLENPSRESCQQDGTLLSMDQVKSLLLFLTLGDDANTRNYTIKNVLFNALTEDEIGNDKLIGFIENDHVRHHYTAWIKKGAFWYNIDSIGKQEGDIYKGRIFKFDKTIAETEFKKRAKTEIGNYETVFLINN